MSLRDKLKTGMPVEVTATMYKMVNALSDNQHHTQLQAVTLLFHLMAEHAGIRKTELLEIGDNIILDARRSENEHLRAFQLYLENEL